MKKAILLFLFAIASLQAQRIPQNSRLAITKNQKDNNANRVIVQDSITGELSWILKSGLVQGVNDAVRIVGNQLINGKKVLLENSFYGNGVFSQDDSQLLINRIITDEGSITGFHALRDESLYNTNAISGLRAYASFDAIPVLEGTAHFNHLHGFQSRPNFSGSNLIDAVRGFTFRATYNGNVDYSQGLFIDDYLGSGTVNQNIGLHIRPLTKGNSNFAIFTEGLTPSFFGGILQTNSAIIGHSLRLNSFAGNYGRIVSFDSFGNLLDNPNLTIVNGVLEMKSSVAKLSATTTNLDLDAFYNIRFFTSSLSGSEKMRLNYLGYLELLKTPQTSASSYDLLTRNTLTGEVEKISSTIINILPNNNTFTGTNTFSNYTNFGDLVRLKNYTVATLPEGNEGDICYVTDAMSPSYMTTVVGGGAVKCLVFFNGISWVSN
jgi:hypothetical protein